MRIDVQLSDRTYPIHISRGLLDRAGRVLDLDRRVFLAADSGVPEGFVRKLAGQCRSCETFTIRSGEASKTVGTWTAMLEAMLRCGMTRSDCVIAVGGGMVGDLAGFAAASYMRGIDFYSVPTTLLAMADASVGGKTALNLGGVKNAIGAFRQPKAVLIDPDVLHTLPRRQIANGMAEIVKMALCLDAEIFARLESADHPMTRTELITAAVGMKKAVVEADERETGLRRVLNFGHTLGHGIEAARRAAASPRVIPTEAERSGEIGLPVTGAEAAARENCPLLHGECVALGMLPMCAPEVRACLIPILERLELPTYVNLNPDAALAAIAHDKKSGPDGIAAVTVSAPGVWHTEAMTLPELRARLETITRP